MVKQRFDIIVHLINQVLSLKKIFFVSTVSKSSNKIYGFNFCEIDNDNTDKYVGIFTEKIS